MERKLAELKSGGSASTFAMLLAASWRWTPLGEWIDLEATIKGLGDLRGDAVGQQAHVEALARRDGDGARC